MYCFVYFWKLLKRMIDNIFEYLYKFLEMSNKKIEDIVEALFKKYDKDRSLLLSYEEF